MSKKNRTALDDRFDKILQNAEQQAKINKEDIFDSRCYNDYCTTYQLTGQRGVATCFKDHRGLKYLIYCDCCGEDHTLTKDEFKRFQSTYENKKEKKVVPIRREEEFYEYEEEEEYAELKFKY